MTEEDILLFRKSMQDVKPLKPDNKVLPHKKNPLTHPKQVHINKAQPCKDTLSEKYEPANVELGDELSFMRAGIQHNVMLKLKRGQFSIKDELDLHGMVVRIARKEVINFLCRCQQLNFRCVRIIHGKGYGSRQHQPILKNQINQWLRQRNEVLAFCSARPSDGGTGAIYVLIKQNK